MATYWYRYFLLTPRNVLRKFRIPVHSPSSVLTWTSRTPSPSSSRAHSRSAWHTVDRERPIPGSPLYPCHSSVLTATIGQVARRTTRCNVLPSDRSATVSRSVPLSRPTTPHTGGRSFSQVPWPRALFARRRGGSSGSVCGTPFFPRILVGLVGLDEVVRQRPARGGGRGAGLDLVPKPQQVRPAGPRFAGQPRGRYPLDEPPQDQQDRGGGAVGPLPGGAGEQIEHPPACLAPVVDDRAPIAAAVDVVGVAAAAATRAGQSVGVEQVEELLVAGLLVHQVEDREVHGVAS